MANVIDYTIKLHLYAYLNALEDKKNCTVILSSDQFEDIRELFDVYDNETGEYQKNTMKDYLKENNITILIRPKRMRNR